MLALLQRDRLPERPPQDESIVGAALHIGDQAEYVLITLWDDMDAVRWFAGPDPEKAVYYPEDDRYFAEEERRPTVAHYEVRSYPE